MRTYCSKYFHIQTYLFTTTTLSGGRYHRHTRYRWGNGDTEKLSRGRIQISGSIICTPTPGILLSLVTNLLGNDLCPSSPHWTVSSRRAETIYVFFHYYIPNAQPRTKLRHCKLHILPRVIPLLRGRAGFQPRTTVFQSPSNFYLGWRGSVDWVPACEPKGHWFYSQSGHMPGLQARSPVGGMGEATTHECFSPYFVPFPSL